MSEPDHYETLFDSNYLRWFHLKGREWTLTIASVKQEELTLRGGVKKKAPVVTFTKAEKPLVLNKTNAEQIAKCLGTVRVKDWIGKSVTLYEATTQMYDSETKKMETVSCIRIKKARVGDRLSTTSNEAE